MATQQQSKTEIVHDVTNAVKLEQELQQVQEHHGVAVLDVYSSEWGFTKALSETFRRLHMDSCDGTYLRFFSVECNSVLETIDQTSERHKHMKDDEKKQFRETLSTFWKDILEGRRGKSKSFFVFFKEGTKRTSIEGVNTPKIISCVNELCRVQRPAKEFTGKTQLLNFWEYHFSQGESEVFWESFVRAALEHSEATRQLTTKENQTLADVIGVEGEKVSVQALDKWVADQTVEGALLTVFPFLSKDYEDPMASVAKKRLGLGESTGDDSTIDGGFVNILTSNCEVRTTKKPALWQQVLELQLRYPPTEHLVLMSHQHGAQEATEALAVMENLQTLNAYLTERNVTAENIHMMCHAAAEKGLSGSLSYAKLALLLVSCNDETLGRLIGVSENVVDKLLKGELIKEYPALAYTVICHCASEVPCEKSFYYCRSDASHVEQIEIAQEGNQVVLPPFTQLSTSGETEGAFKVEVRGIPQVIELTAPEEGKEALVLTHWFVKCDVKEVSENHLVLHFAEMVENERLRALLEDYSRRTQDDEERLTAPSDVIALYERSLGLGHEFSIPSIDTQNNFIASGAAAIGSSINGTNISGGGGSPEANGGSDAEVHNGFHVSKGSVGESGGYKSVSRGSISKGSVGKIVGAAPGGSASHERLDEASAEGRSTGVDGESEEAESAIPQPEAEGSVRRESVSKGSVAEVVGAATGGSASHERLDEASAEGRSTGVDGESEEAESAIPQPEAEGSVRRESVSKGSVRKESVSKGSVAEVVGAATGGSASRERLDEASAEGRSTGVDGESEEAESAIPQPEAEGSVGREPANVVDRSEDCDESSAGRKPTDDEDGVSDRANGDVWLADAGESNSRGSAGENRGTTAEDFDSEG